MSEVKARLWVDVEEWDTLLRVARATAKQSNRKERRRIYITGDERAIRALEYWRGELIEALKGVEHLL